MRNIRPVAIALVFQDDNGTMHIVGSKAVDSFSLEISTDADPFLFSSQRYRRPPHNLRIEADCGSAIWQRTTPAPLPRQIEQRGIYLPDMSFRALPGPEEV